VTGARTSTRERILDTAAAAARLSRAIVLTLAVEHLAMGPDDARAASRIDDLVTTLLPS
jgi:hypothetical protein